MLGDESLHRGHGLRPQRHGDVHGVQLDILHTERVEDGHGHGDVEPERDQLRLDLPEELHERDGGDPDGERGQRVLVLGLERGLRRGRRLHRRDGRQQERGRDVHAGHQPAAGERRLPDQQTGHNEVYWKQNNRLYHVTDAGVLDTMQNAGMPRWGWGLITW